VKKREAPLGRWVTLRPLLTEMNVCAWPLDGEADEKKNRCERKGREKDGVTRTGGKTLGSALLARIDIAKALEGGTRKMRRISTAGSARQAEGHVWGGGGGFGWGGGGGGVGGVGGGLVVCCLWWSKGDNRANAGRERPRKRRGEKRRTIRTGRPLFIPGLPDGEADKRPPSEKRAKEGQGGCGRGEGA